MLSICFFQKYVTLNPPTSVVIAKIKQTISIGHEHMDPLRHLARVHLTTIHMELSMVNLNVIEHNTRTALKMQ